MVATPSTMVPLGTRAPDFKLPDPRGRTVSLADFEGKRGLIVVFVANHCPYVQHIRERWAAVARDLPSRGIGVVAISSNDVTSYPQDGPAEMAKEAERFGYTFPYLFDETQAVARAYRAACTPDFYLFDADRKLVYRGQFDGARPGNRVPVTGADLAAAVSALLEGRVIPEEDQKPSMGCNIKWRSGNNPDYFPA